ncbi:hypothetical protein GCM10027020_17660 [Nocardioides salsibiostraticola]
MKYRYIRRVTTPRFWHLLTAVVAVGALLLQLILVLQGGRVLDEQEIPGLGIRVGRLASYFTIQSNLLVAITAAILAVSPQYDARWWRVARLDAVVGIAITGVVHFFLLLPLLDLSGADYVADKLLHMVVPALAVIGWLAFGPRPRVSASVVRWALLWPVAWLLWTLSMGLATGWFPYPFLDHREDGWAAVVVVSVAIMALFVGLSVAARWWDQRFSPSRTTSTSAPLRRG